MKFQRTLFPDVRNNNRSSNFRLDIDEFIARMVDAKVALRLVHLEDEKAIVEFDAEHSQGPTIAKALEAFGIDMSE